MNPVRSSSSPSPSPSSSSSACSSTPLFSAYISPLDSPPDSPATPWRPGSTAYPSTSSAAAQRSSGSSPPSFSQAKLELQRLYDALSEGSYDLSLRDIVDAHHTLLDQSLQRSEGGAGSSGDGEKIPTDPVSTKGEHHLQLCCAEGDLLMSQEARNSSGGGDGASADEIKKERRGERDSIKNPKMMKKKKKKQSSARSSGGVTGSCHKSTPLLPSPLGSTAQMAAASQTKCKISLRFSFPAISCRFLAIGGGSGGSGGSAVAPLRVIYNTPPSPSSSPRTKPTDILQCPPSPPPSEDHLLLRQTPPPMAMAMAPSSKVERSASSSSLSSRSNPSKRYSNSECRSTNSCSRSQQSDQLLQKSKKNQMKYITAQYTGGGGGIGSSSRVHPSSQCSSCASYTVFFKSRCTVCAKLYCSNCAKDAMDNATDGRRCKSTCAHIVRTSRFSSSLKTKCWPLCGSVDVMKIANKSSDSVDI